MTIAELHLRTGQSSIAVNTCRSVLRNHFASRGILARCHIVLGTASRDEGRLEEAVEHFHRALSIATDVPSREAATWSYLRLMLALAEHTGPQAALALLPDVRRHIIQLGDGQAVAALHFFLAEIETKRGLYNSVREHLAVGRRHLDRDPNVWLGGFASIAELCLAYVQSDLKEVKRNAKEALESARQSGHTITGMAAMTNVGHELLAEGNYRLAAKCLYRALAICPRGGGAETAVLDGLAQVALAAGSPPECGRVVAEIDQHTPALGRDSYYYLCTYLTRGRLCLQRGNERGAIATLRQGLKSLGTKELAHPLDRPPPVVRGGVGAQRAAGRGGRRHCRRGRGVRRGVDRDDRRNRARRGARHGGRPRRRRRRARVRAGRADLRRRREPDGAQRAARRARHRGGPRDWRGRRDPAGGRARWTRCRGRPAA